MVVDAELFRLDAIIRWLDATDGRLRRAAADESPPLAPAPPLPKLRRRVSNGVITDRRQDTRGDQPQ